MGIITWRPSVTTVRPLDEALERYIMRDIRRTGLVIQSDEPELREALDRLASEDKE